MKRVRSVLVHGLAKVKALAAIALLAAFSIAAHSNESGVMATETGGFGKWLIDTLFESGDITTMPGSPGWIGNVILPFSMVAMAVAALIVIGKSVQHLLIVAQAKDPSASPVSMTWAPLHMVTAVVLIMPLPSGYSLGQYGAIWVGEQSNQLGNLVSERAATYVGNQGVVTPPPIPEIQHLIKSAVASHSCAMIYNDAYTLLAEEFQGGSDNQVRIMAKDNDSWFDWNEKSNAHVISFARTGPNWFGWTSTDNSFCGELAIAHNEFDNEPVEVGGLCRSGGKGEPNRICSALTHSDYLKNLSDELNLTSRSLQTVLMEAVTGHGQSNAIARQLFYDIPMQLRARVNDSARSQLEELRKQEDQMIEEAVNNTIKLYEHYQKRVYAGYAQAVRNTNKESTSGNDWLDIIMEQGWPAFGIYWFQMTTTNQRTLEATGLSFSGSSNFGAYAGRFGDDIDDEVIATIMQARWSEYIDRLETRIQNTRHDIKPTANNVYDDDGYLIDTEGNRVVSNSMAEVKNMFPAMKEEMKKLAANGSMEADSIPQAVGQFFSSFTKEHLFPVALNTMRSGGNIVTGMVNTGHWIITLQEALYLMDAAQRGAYKAWEFRRDTGQIKKSDESAPQVQAVKSALASVPLLPKSIENSLTDFASSRIFSTTLGQTFMTVLSDFVRLLSALLFVGLFLAFYIPAVVLIQWVIGVITWMIYLVEAIIVIPLWGLLFVSDMGSQALSPQSARQGLVHILSILFYPALMIIGFVVGIKIIDIASSWFIDIMEIGFNQFTEGYTFGIVSLAAGLAIIGFAAYQVITRVFSLVLEFNQRMMNWIGQYNNYGEHNIESQVKQGFVAFMYQGRSAGHQATNADYQARSGDPTAHNRQQTSR